jgi:hypothetical protein
MEFKAWLEYEEFPLEPSEYDPPDEDEMQKILNTPIRCDNPPSLDGDRYRFAFRLGKMADFTIRFGGIVAPNAKPGSLNARCFDLVRKRDCAGLYKLLRYVQFNNNPAVRRQLLKFSET